MRFLAHFSGNASTDAFRIPELQSIAATCGVRLEVINTPDMAAPRCRFDAGLSPFLVVDVPSVADARKLASKSVLLRFIYALFGHGPSVAELACTMALRVSAETVPDLSELSHKSEDLLNHFGSKRIRPYLGETVSYCYDFECFEKHYSETDKKAIQELFSSVGHAGVVNYRAPDVTFSLCIAHDKNTRCVLDAFYCILVAASGRTEFMDEYSLKKRRYIGTTSMPPELCFLMSNLAKVDTASLVWDPFCGTGSTLVAAGALGSRLCFGSDMDGRNLHSGAISGQQALHDLSVRTKLWKTGKNAFGHSVKEGSASVLPSSTSDGWVADVVPSGLVEPATLRTNFYDYSLGHGPELFRLNFSVAESLFYPKLDHGFAKKHRGFLDAIITDPPYGLREPKLKLKASDTAAAPSAATEKVAQQILTRAGGASEQYGVTEMSCDLIAFAASALVVGGRLVYWHPTVGNFSEVDVPRHPSFHLVAVAAQNVTLKIRRALVVLEKVAHVPNELPWNSSHACVIEALRSGLPEKADVRAVALGGKELPADAGVQDEVDRYKAKRQAIRDATHEFWANRGEGAEPGAMPRRHCNLDASGRPLTKAELRSRNMSNRARNLEKRAARHAENTEKQRETEPFPASPP